MKTVTIVVSSLACPFLFAPLRAELTIVPDMPPVNWLEETSGGPGADFVSLAFRTTPGVQYFVQTSTNLTNWVTLEGDYYGLGQEVAVPLFEKPRNATTGGGGNSPQPGTPSVFVSLVMRPAAGGGIMLSWRSLGTGTAMQRHLPAESAAAEWMNVPLYANAFGGYSFMISHPGTIQSPPSNPLDLGPEDREMIDVFEQNFVAMNAEVMANVIRARNSSPHPPTPQGAQRFWRVVPRWSLDSDSDGTEDWIEFNYAASTPTAPSTSELGDSSGDTAAYADAFLGDSNNNGIADGNERDSDGDKVFDNVDAAKSDKRINWTKNGPMRFAWFSVQPPAEGSKTPKQVNDQGKILFEQSFWHNGQFTDLSREGTDVTGCRPLALGDSGRIIGNGLVYLSSDHSRGNYHCMVSWPTTGGSPFVLKNGNDYPSVTYSAFVGFGADMLLTADDKFVGTSYTKEFNQESEGYYLKLAETDPRRVWQIQPGEAGASAGITQVSQAPEFAVWVDANGVFWGFDTSSIFSTGGGTGAPHHFQKSYSRAVPLPHGVSAVFQGYEFNNLLKYETGAISPPQFRPENAWIECDNAIFRNSLDFSTVGRFSISRHFYVWHNGTPFTVRELSPGLSDEWEIGTETRLLDTTAHGWTLAVKKDESNPPLVTKVIVGVPLFLEMPTPSEGLDAVSMSVNRSFGTAVTLKGSKEEFWIMVPAGGQIPVRVKSGACPDTPITLGGGNGKVVTASPASVNANDTTVTFSAPTTAAGTEEAVSVKLGTLDSLTIPLRAKIMKPRIVEVSVWPIADGVNGTPPVVPTKSEFETYLNGIYKKQLNVTFNVTIQTTPGADSDTDHNNLFDVSDPPNAGQLAISNTRKSGNIQVYVMGGRNLLFPPGTKSIPVTGWANPDEAFTWMAVDNPTGVNETQHEQWLNTVAHEIGHVFFQAGHPNTPKSPGAATLPGTDHMVRLMHNGFGHIGTALIRRVCVKAEWDMAEDWLEKEEREGRLAN